MGLSGLVVPVLANAASSITRQMENVRRLESEIAGLDARYNQAAIAYDGAQARLETVRGRIRTNTKELADARVAFRKAQALLAFRVSAAYRQREPSSLEVLLGSGSLSEALARVDVLNRVQRQDAEVIDQISKTRERMRKARVQLLADQDEAKVQRKEARTRLGEVRSIRSARRGVLISARRQLSVMIAAEVRRRANAQRLAGLRAAQRRVIQRVGQDGNPTPAAPAAAPQTAPVSGGTDAGGELERIAQCESGGNPTAVSPSGLYRGKYQFDPQTWQSLGGTGDPAAAPEAEQDRIAGVLYAQRGAAPWPVCGR